MKRVTIKSDIDLDDNGNILRCRVGTAPGYAPMFSVAHEGTDAFTQCGTDLRRHFKMEAYRADFDRLVAAPTKGAA